MTDATELFKILEETYGITTVAQLDEAIKKLGNVNISVFCSKTERKKSDQKITA